MCNKGRQAFGEGLFLRELDLKQRELRIDWITQKGKGAGKRQYF